jgi:lysozyme family protein
MRNKTMANFYEFAPLLHSLEKGVADHKEDKGGFTVDGVTLSTFRQFYGAHKTREDLLAMTAGEWAFIMKSGYWDKAKADQIDNQKTAEIIADWCVNSGTARIRDVQTILGVKPDGAVGPITLKAINSADPAELYRRLMNARIGFFEKIVARNPSQKKFLKGWLNRLKRLEDGE